MQTATCGNRIALNSPYKLVAATSTAPRSGMATFASSSFQALTWTHRVFFLAPFGLTLVATTRCRCTALCATRHCNSHTPNLTPPARETTGSGDQAALGSLCLHECPFHLGGAVARRSECHVIGPESGPTVRTTRDTENRSRIGRVPPGQVNGLIGIFVERAQWGDPSVALSFEHMPCAGDAQHP